MICGRISPRIIHADKSEVWWIDKNTRDFWHESIGMFLFNRERRILLFKRVIYPFVYTIPAGHLGVGENPLEAAIREVKEETGIILDSARLVSEEDIAGDECKWGADHHRWHLYEAEIANDTQFKINSEGNQGGWHDLKAALRLELTKPTRYFIEKYFL
jgi:8-oxo-dGTP pyrophosphatase MutT (NUDIX family)